MKKMKKRIVRLTESDLEKLVKRIIKEEEGGPVSGAQLKKTFMDKKKDVASGLTPAERELLNKVMNQFTEFFKQSGNQAVGRVNTFLDRVFDEMAKKFKDTGKEGDKQQPTTSPKDDENFDF